MTAIATYETILPRLWIYSNYDCNLSCSYCVVMASPKAERRGIPYNMFCQLVDEAADLGLDRIFVTGGEPFLLPDIFDKLAYASGKVHTTVLTNAMLFSGKRLGQLKTLVGRNVSMQVSLDGADAESHNAYRGPGAWEKGVQGIRTLQELGFTVYVGSTETPANSAKLDKLRSFVDSLGIPEERHYIRKLARRGASADGIDLTVNHLIPELTVNIDGVFWHPFGTEGDMMLTRNIFPLADAVRLMSERYRDILHSGYSPERFHCGVV